MTEEINFSYDGGLYAENGHETEPSSGRWHSQPAHWFFVEQGNSDGKMETDDSTGPSRGSSNRAV